jgi:hypothetical protein
LSHLKLTPHTVIICRYDLKSSSRLSRKIRLSPILYSVQGDKMIILIVILTALFILAGISPLLVTEEMRDIVSLEQP